MSNPLLQSLKDQFPTLQIELKNDSICVNMQGFSYSLTRKGSNNELEINEDAIKLTENYVIFTRLEISLLEKDLRKYGGLLLWTTKNLVFYIRLKVVLYQVQKGLILLSVVLDKVSSMKIHYCCLCSSSRKHSLDTQVRLDFRKGLKAACWLKTNSVIPLPLDRWWTARIGMIYAW